MMFSKKGLYLCLTVILAITVCSGSVYAAFKPSVRGKKLIASGWHLPSTSWFRDNIAEAEKLPFDGVLLGGYYPFWPNMRGQKDRLPDDVEIIKSINFQKFTDNFLSVESGNDGNFDWFDDTKCKDLVENWRLLAKASKDAGLKGFKFDPECYEGPSPFNFDTLMHKDTVSAEKYAERIEKVAGEIIEVINQEYPDITLLFYFGASVAGYPRNLEGWCGMMPAFVDGLLNAAKPGFKIVDGFEQAYGYRTEKLYADGRKKMVDTANYSRYPDAYKKHVQVGFAVWPGQMAGNPMIGRKSFNVDNIDANYYVPEEVAYIANNALRYADEYVWMWEESINVWTDSVMVWDNQGSWEFKPLPDGYIDALQKAKTGVVPVPPIRSKPRSAIVYTAKDLGEIDDTTVFGDLWNSYTEILNLPLKWKFLPDRNDAGQKAGYHLTSFDDLFWPTIQIREIWDQQGFADLSPYGWYRVRLDVPEVQKGKKLFLAFGAVDEAAYVYVNGRFAGSHDIDPDIGYKERFLIDVTKLVKPGKTNLVVVKVKNIYGVGEIWRGVKLISEK